MAGVGDDAAVLRRLQVVAIDDVLVAGDGDDDIGVRNCLDQRHHLEAVHRRLDGAHRLDLGDDHLGAHAERSHRDAAAAPAVAADDEHLAGDQDVGGAQDAVEHALAGAVAIVEQVLGVGVVDRDHRIFEGAVGSHGAQPDDAGGGFFGAAHDAVEQFAASGVQLVHQIGAVVDGDLRADIEGGGQPAIVAVVVIAAVREHRNVVGQCQRRSDVVLRRQRVAGAQRHLGATLHQHPGKVGGLGGNVQAGGDAHAVERTLLGETAHQRAQHRHLGERPFDPIGTGRGEGGVFDIVSGRGHLGDLLARTFRRGFVVAAGQESPRYGDASAAAGHPPAGRADLPVRGARIKRFAQTVADDVQCDHCHQNEQAWPYSQ